MTEDEWFESLPGIKHASMDLYDSDGNVVMDKIAELFDLKPSQTPDSNKLKYFVQVSWLRCVLIDSDFKKWLTTSNKFLEEITPINCMADLNRPEVVADLVKDMLINRGS